MTASATRCVFGWLILLPLLLAAGCFSHPDLRPGRTRFRQPSVLVPAQVVGGHFLVQSKWDKHGPWNFLIDTGSSVTLVSKDFAKFYATERPALDAPSVRVRGANGNSSLLPAVTLRRLDLGGVRFDNIDALIGDLSDISQHLGIKIDGILGFPLFRETIFTLDYPSNQLLLLPSNTTAQPAGSTIKFNNDQRTPLIPVQLGDTRVFVLIDSGSDGPFELNPAGLNWSYAVPPRPGATVGTLSGDRTQHVGRLEQSISIGNFEFKKPIVDLTDQLSSIGGDVLKNFSVTFDQAHNRVTFSRPDGDVVETPPKLSAGLAFAKGPTYWRVVAVVPGSPAEEAGVQVGDLVTRINGESITNWPLNRYETYVRRSSEIVFTFLEGSKERPVVVPIFQLVP